MNEHKQKHIQEITLVIPTIPSNQKQKQESMRGITPMWGEGVVLPRAGVGEWVVSGNKGLTEEGAFVVFSLSMYVWYIRQGESSA